MSHRLARAHSSDIVQPIPGHDDYFPPSLLSRAPSVNEFRARSSSIGPAVNTASALSFPFRYHKDYDLVHGDYWSSRNHHFSHLYDTGRPSDNYYWTKARPYWTNYRSELFEYSHPFYRSRYSAQSYEPYFRTSYYSPRRAELYDRMTQSFYKSLNAFCSGISGFSALNHSHITRNSLDKRHFYRPRQVLTAWT